VTFRPAIEIADRRDRFLIGPEDADGVRGNTSSGNGLQEMTRSLADLGQGVAQRRAGDAHQAYVWVI
jgi:hypothetical protein